VVGYKTRLKIPRQKGAFSDTIKVKASAVLAPIPDIMVATNCKKKVTATTLMQNETQVLDEWLRHYYELGVEHFYLYDNNTDDQDTLAKVLRPWQEYGLVTLIHWNFPYGPTNGQFNKWLEHEDRERLDFTLSAVNDHRYCQPAQTNDALLRFGQGSEWMFLIDVDEYLNTRGKTIPQLIEELGDKKTILSFATIWFGNPRKEPVKVPEGESVRGWYRYRDAKSCGNTRRKCLVNPRRFQRLDALYHVHSPLRATTVKGNKNKHRHLLKEVTCNVSESDAIIHHYYCTSSKDRNHGHDEILDESLVPGEKMTGNIDPTHNACGYSLFSHHNSLDVWSQFHCCEEHNFIDSDQPSGEWSGSSWSSSPTLVAAVSTAHQTVLPGSSTYSQSPCTTKDHRLRQ